MTKPAANGMVYSQMQDRREGGSLNKMSATRKPNHSAFCSHCGAWRGSLGLEPTYDLYVEHLVAVFREVRRVLRSDGTVWLVLGDSYATGAGKVGESPGGGEQGARWKGYRGTRPESPLARSGAMGPMTQPNRMPQPGLKPKDLVGIPWRVAFALQADGWWIRSDIIWAKGVSFCPTYNGAVMPESVRDRPTRAHEYVFLLTKSERYWSNFDAIREPHADATYRRLMQETFETQAGGPKDGQSNPNRSHRTALQHLHKRLVRGADWDDRRPQSRARAKTANTPHARGRRQAPEPGEPDASHPLGRNVRTVWTINPQPYPEAHFATFPEALVLPCILAGSPAGGAVLDPFAGSGTTLMVAAMNGRNSVGIELNEAYLSLIQARLAGLETDLVYPVTIGVQRVE